jgi:phage shock protein C
MTADRYPELEGNNTVTGEPQDNGRGTPTPRRLTRSRNRIIAGVAAGIAEYFGIDPVLVRLVFVALSFAGGSGLALYIVAALFMPEEGEDEAPGERLLRRLTQR